MRPSRLLAALPAALVVALPSGADAAPLRIAAPAADTIVDGKAVKVAVRAPAGAGALRLTRDGRRIAARFRAVGGRRVATVRGLGPGTANLGVRLRVRGRTTYAHRRIVVKGARARLLRAAPSTSGVLRHAGDEGVGRLAFRTVPNAKLRARLNGRAVLVGRADAKGVRRVLVNRRDGLRRGRNTLVIVAYLRDGRWDRMRERIVVSPGAPMAAAGKDRRVTGGDRIRLDGSRSDAAAQGSDASYRWRVVQAPGRGAGRVSGPSGRKATLRLRRPGRYAVALTMTERRRDGSVRRSTDLLQADALAPVPPLGARLDTMAADPQNKRSGTGLLIDSTWKASGTGNGKQAWYPGPAAGAATMYAFDAGSLKPDSDFDGTIGSDVDASLGRLLGSQAKGKIIVIVGRDGCCAGSKRLPTSRDFSYVFTYDGQGLTNFGSAGTWNRGRQIGTPDDPSRAGQLTGFLRIDDNDQIFRFVQDDSVPYATASPDQPTLGPADGATYRLGVAGGKAIGVDGDPDGRESRLSVADASDAISQQWTLRRAYGQYFQLVNARSGMCMNLSGRDGTSVIQFPCSSTDQYPLNELWMPYRPPGEDFYTLRSATSSAAHAVVVTDVYSLLAVRPENAKYTGQAVTLQLAPGIYTIAAPDTGQVMAEPDATVADGGGLVMKTAAGTAQEQWRLEYGPGESFKLVNLASGKCADIYGGAGNPGDVVDRWECDPGGSVHQNERWTATPDADGIVLRSPLADDLVMSRKGGKVIVNEDGYRDQRWMLQRVPTAPGYQGTYALVAEDPQGKGVAITGGNDGSASLSVVGADAKQQWTVSGPADALKIARASGDQCLDQGYPGGDRSAARPIVDKCGAQSNQVNSTWRAVEQQDGSYLLGEPGDGGRYLSRNADGSLGFTGQASDALRWRFVGRSVTFRIGNQRPSTALPPGASGFVVLPFDAAQRIGGPFTYITGGPGADPGAAARLGAYLKDLAGRDGITALVQSVGRPKPNGGGWNDAADAIAALGGNKSTFLQLDGSGDYALVGCSGCNDEPQPVFDERLRRQVDAQVVGARLNGTLERDKSSAWRPTAATAALFDDTLGDLLRREQAAWPYDDGDDGTRALRYLADKLDLKQTCDADIGPVRNAYCPKNAGASTTWPDKLDTLHDQAYPKDEDPGFSEATFDAVKPQLVTEFKQLDDVNSMLQGVSNVVDWTSDSGNSGSTVAGLIWGNMGRPQQRGKSVAGGVLDLIGSTIEVAVQFAPLLADQPGLQEEPDPFKPAEALGALLGLTHASMDLAGDNDGGGEGVSLDGLRADALDYAADLDAQMNQVRANLVVTQSSIVSDPTKLAIASDNSAELWNTAGGSAKTMRSSLRAGNAHAMWAKLLPAAFQMWSFPAVPSDLHFTDLHCFNGYSYTDQPDSAIYIKANSVDGNGNLADHQTLSLTANSSTDLDKNEDRVARQPLVSRLYGEPNADDQKVNGGYAPGETPWAIPFKWVDYNDMEGHWNCWLQNRVTHRATAYQYP